MANLCDLAWLIRDNPQFVNTNVMSGTCSNGTSFTNLNSMGFTSCNITTTTLQPSTTKSTTTAVTPTTTTSPPAEGCPPASSISPCTCSTSHPGGPIFLYVYCSNLNVTDLQFSKALNVFLSPQYISPVVSMYASYNQLTQIPSQIAKFKSLAYLDLSYNQITNISSLNGLIFSSNASFVSIMLNNNKITNVPSGTFNCTASSTYYCTIDLSYNNITALSTKAFTYLSTNSMAMNMLNLKSNQIAGISPGAFQGIFSFYSIRTSVLSLHL